MARDRETVDQRVRNAAFLIAGMGLWLLTRPFTFRENDGALYALMALARINPERFGADLFLAFGSQDSFSVFSPLYAAFIGGFGLGAGAMVLLLGAAALWVFASWSLCRRLIASTGKAQVAFLFLCAVHIAYAGWRMPVGDGVLTSRILSEALSLLALSEATSRRWLRSGVLMLAAMAFHPLMGLAALASAFLTIAFARPKWLWLLPLGAVTLVALVLAHIPPFDRVLTIVDPAWLAEIERRNGYVFIRNWSIDAWARLAMESCVVALAAWRSTGWRRQALIAVVLVALGGLVASWLGADLCRNALVIQMQLWRSAWPLAWAAVPAVALLVREEDGLRGWVAACSFAAALLTRDPILIAFLTGVGVLAACFHSRLSDLTAKAALAVLTVILVASQIAALYPMLAGQAALANLGFRDPPWEVPYFFGWVLAPVLAAAILARPRVGLVLAAIALVATGSRWDQRSDWLRYVTSDVPPPIAISGPVLWGPEANGTWFLLRQSSFLSLQQSAGLLFSREQASAWRTRMAGVQGVVPDELWSEAAAKPCDQARPQLTRTTLAAICARPQHPVSVMTPRPIAGSTAAAAFSAPAPNQTVCLIDGKLAVMSDRRFYRYDCPATP